MLWASPTLLSKQLLLGLAQEFSQWPRRPSVLGSEVAEDLGGWGRGRASWPLGNWKGSKNVEEGIPAGERKSCAKINLDKSRQGLLSWLQVARRIRSTFLFSASSSNLTA